MHKIQMVDLHRQYLRLKAEIDESIAGVLTSTNFIQGPEVAHFSDSLSGYLGGSRVVTCGNGTDALQIAMMALDMKPGDEVVIPAFTYVAVAEVIALLGLTPVLVDVDENTFNINVQEAEHKITRHTKAIVPVHLFGQCANMGEIMRLAGSVGIDVIEDAAQSLGSTYHLGNKTDHHAGTMGRIGITSFFPTKTLGCFGDGGAVFTADDELAQKIRMIANHGQRIKYTHEMIGVNSRLDTLQASILNVKLRHIRDFTHRRQMAAEHYDKSLADIQQVQIPRRDFNSTHVFHQYTLTVARRDDLQQYLTRTGIPSMVYYPFPLHFQKAYSRYSQGPGSYPVAEKLTKDVISLPMHTEMEPEQIDFICGHIRRFYNA